MADNEDNDGRDERGRWKKGFCPNRNGRPRKQPEISDADINYFRTTLVTATINGERRDLTREELLLHVMFERAIKGNVALQRKLFDRFEQSEETMTKAQMMLREMERELVTQYRQHDKFDEALHDEITELRAMLDAGRRKGTRKPRVPGSAARSTPDAADREEEPDG